MIHMKTMLRRLHRPVGGDGADTGGGTATLDRGDTFEPTPEELEALGGLPGKDVKPSGEEGEKSLRQDGGADDEADPENEGKDKPDGRKAPRIPLDRHEKILAKERDRREALERELAKYQQGQEVARTNAELSAIEDKVIELEKQYATALADGETTKAAQIMREIRQGERTIMETKAELREQATFIRAREAARYDITLERIEEAYPKLNPDDAAYDPELLADVADLKEVYERRGMGPAKALQAAVKKLLGSDSRAQETATTVTPRVDAKDVAAARKAGAVEKAVDTQRRTPPSTRDVGMNSDKAGQLQAKDIMKMSQSEFSSLTEEQLSKLRGDDV